MLRRLLVILSIATSIPAPAWASSAFSDLRCGADIPKALIGKKLEPSKPTSKTEEENKSIDLKFLSGDGADGEAYSLGYWRICGKEYVLLSSAKAPAVIQAVIEFPERSTDETDVMAGECSYNGNFRVIGIATALAKDAGYKEGGDSVLVTKAWEISLSKMKFQPVPGARVHCTN
jgi:hypothetical protein